MKLITRNTDYAIRAVSFIAVSKNELVKTQELVRALKIPQPFLRKILQSLNRKKIVRSYKGPGGGFKLAVKPKEISIVDLIEVFQGPLEVNKCLFKKEICPNSKKCTLRIKMNKIEDHIKSELKSITIEDLLRA